MKQRPNFFWSAITVVSLVNVLVLSWWFTEAQKHSGLWSEAAAAWLQGIGSIDAILAAILIDLFRREQDYGDAEEQRSMRADIVAVKLLPILTDGLLHLGILHDSFDRLRITVQHNRGILLGEERMSAKANELRTQITKQVLSFKKLSELDEIVIADHDAFPPHIRTKLIEYATAIQTIRSYIGLLQRIGNNNFVLLEHGAAPQEIWSDWDVYVGWLSLAHAAVGAALNLAEILLDEAAVPASLKTPELQAAIVSIQGKARRETSHV